MTLKEFRDWLYIFRRDRRAIQNVRKLFALTKNIDHKLKQHKLVFFFPYYCLGGAEKVHIDILKAIGGSRPLVIFTYLSPNDILKPEFDRYAETIDIQGVAKYNLYIKILLRQIIRHLNSSDINKVILGCNTHYFYDIVGKIKNPGIKKIDLLHAFSYPDYGVEQYSIPFVEKIDYRIIENDKTFNDFKNQYTQHGIDLKNLDRIIKIINAVRVPTRIPPKDYNAEPLKIIYCGRVTHEKRPSLFIQVAVENKNAGEFMMVGDLTDIKEEIINNDIHYYENVTDDKLAELYSGAHILLLTSIREGMPMVVMEAMSRGVVCICTNVGGISEHIVHGENGFLVKNDDDEQKIITEFSLLLKELNSDRKKLEQISKNAYGYAFNHFNVDIFNKKYRELLLQ